jgi:hypothetical protein
LPILRFSLRQMFWLVTLVCLLVAAVVSAPGPGITSLAVLLAALVVGLHVAGTALGTRLREHADRQRAWETEVAPVTAGEVAGKARHPASEHCTHRSAAAAAHAAARLPFRRRGLAMPWLPLCVGIGVVVGLCMGAMLLVAGTVGNRASAIGVVVGAISTAVLGGWFAFLGASFWAILRQGWRDAVSEHHDDEPHGTRSR